VRGLSSDRLRVVSVRASDRLRLLYLGRVVSLHIWKTSGGDPSIYWKRRGVCWSFCQHVRQRFAAGPSVRWSRPPAFPVQGPSRIASGVPWALAVSGRILDRFRRSLLGLCPRVGSSAPGGILSAFAALAVLVGSCQHIRQRPRLLEVIRPAWTAFGLLPDPARLGSFRAVSGYTLGRRSCVVSGYSPGVGVLAVSGYAVGPRRIP